MLDILNTPDVRLPVTRTVSLACTACEEVYTSTDLTGTRSVEELEQELVARHFGRIVPATKFTPAVRICTGYRARQEEAS
jgi:hypothetical protein